MTLRTSLALATATIALISPDLALAKDANPSTQEQLQAALEEIAVLKQQVASLEARMDQRDADAQANARQQGTANAQAIAQAQAASAKADQALAQANSANATAEAAKSDAKQSTAFAGSAKWAADTKVSGRMYYNVSAVSANDANGANVEKDGGFELKRFYVGIDHKFSDVFSGNITTDVTAASGSGAQLYVKKAYLQAKFSPAFTVRIGATDMPWIPYVEGVYGYRHIEKTLTDLDGFGTSSDWGVHVLGSLADGIVSYQVSAINGAGYKTIKPTSTIDFEGRLSINYKGLNAAIGGYTGKLGKDVTGTVTPQTATRFNALLAYKGKLGTVPVTVGGEYFTASNWKQVTSTTSDQSEGYSAFVSVTPVDKWSAFGRYDWIKPSKDIAPLQRDRFYQLGVQYSPAKIVDFALVYKHDSADGGLKIGNLNSGQATRDEIGLYGQFRW